MSDQRFPFEIDPKKLDADGHGLLGELKAVARWCAMFGQIRDNSKDATERMFLAEVIQALDEDGRRLSMALTKLAKDRGALREHQPHGASVPSVAPTTEEKH